MGLVLCWPGLGPGGVGGCMDRPQGIDGDPGVDLPTALRLRPCAAATRPGRKRRGHGESPRAAMVCRVALRGDLGSSRAPGASMGGA
jgi:hypothetical protein